MHRLCSLQTWLTQAQLLAQRVAQGRSLLVHRHNYCTCMAFATRAVTQGVTKHTSVLIMSGSEGQGFWFVCTFQAK
eukprot:3965331-Amphidinium_carterae.1